MPYSNEHAARIADPGKFKEIRRKNDHFGPGIDVLFGVDEAGKTHVQSIHFDKSKFTPEQAKKWLKDHDHSAVKFEPAEEMTKKPNSIVVCMEREGLKTLSKYTNGDGKDVRQYKKSIIGVGDYVHPYHKWTLNVTKERLQKWADAFNLMASNGVDVEVVVDHGTSARDVIGYTTSMEVDGDDLVAVMEVTGDDNFSIVETVKNVSVLIEKEYKDGKGNEYGEVISHVSFVQRPVVPGQQYAERIAASIGGEVDVYFVNDKENKSMKLLEQIKNLLKLSSIPTEEEAAAAISKDLKDKDAEIAKLSASVSELKGKLENIPTDKKAASIPANLAEQMGVTARARLDTLVMAGKLTPAARDKAFGLFVGERGKRNLMALSVGDNGEPSTLDNVVEILELNNPVELAEKTTNQSMVFSREQNSKDQYDPNVTKEMVESANVGR